MGINRSINTSLMLSFEVWASPNLPLHRKIIMICMGKKLFYLKVKDIVELWIHFGSSQKSPLLTVFNHCVAKLAKYRGFSVECYVTSKSLFFSLIWSQFARCYRDAGEKLQDSLLTQRYCKKLFQLSDLTYSLPCTALLLLSYYQMWFYCKWPSNTQGI